MRTSTLSKTDESLAQSFSPALPGRRALGRPAVLLRQQLKPAVASHPRGRQRVVPCRAFWFAKRNHVEKPKLHSWEIFQKTTQPIWTALLSIAGFVGVIMLATAFWAIRAAIGLKPGALDVIPLNAVSESYDSYTSFTEEQEQVPTLAANDNAKGAPQLPKEAALGSWEALKKSIGGRLGSGAAGAADKEHAPQSEDGTQQSLLGASPLMSLCFAIWTTVGALQLFKALAGSWREAGLEKTVEAAAATAATSAVTVSSAAVEMKDAALTLQQLTLTAERGWQRVAELEAELAAMRGQPPQPPAAQDLQHLPPLEQQQAAALETSFLLGAKGDQGTSPEPRQAGTTTVVAV